MIWQLYTFDSFEYMVSILNGVVMLMDHNGGPLGSKFVVIGFTVGLIMAAFRSMFSGRFEFSYLIGSVILYMVMFVPRVDLQVEDIVSNQFDVIQDVPFAVAAGGHFASTLGKTIAENFSIAFSAPNQYDYGYMEPLKIITGLRSGELSRVDADIETFGSGDFSMRRSLKAYIDDCVFMDEKVKSGTLRDFYYDRFMSEGNPLAAMEIKSGVWFVETFLPGQNGAVNSDGAMTNCQNAYNLIKDNLGDQNSGYIHNLINTALDKAKGTGRAEFTGTDLTNLLTDLVGTNLDSFQFMVGAVVNESIKVADKTGGNPSDYANTTTAMILAEARERRQVDMASERSMFMEMVPPLTAFLQSMFIFMAPITAFALALGPIGISLAGKYFLMLLWANSWPVALSVINLYTYLATEKALKEQFNSINSAATEATSVIGVDIIHTTAASWVSTASTLAAATPAITLMLLTGSAYSMVNLAGSIGGSKGYVDSKKAAPEVAKTANFGVSGSADRVAHWSNGYKNSGRNVDYNTSAMGGGTFSLTTSTNSSAEVAQGAQTTQSYKKAFEARQQMQVQIAKAHGFENMSQVTASSDWEKVEAVGKDLLASLHNNLEEGMSLNDGTKATIGASTGAALALGAVMSGLMGFESMQKLREGLGAANLTPEQLDEETKKFMGDKSEKGDKARAKFMAQAMKDGSFAKYMEGKGFDANGKMTKGMSGFAKRITSKLAEKGAAKGLVKRIGSRLLPAVGWGMAIAQVAGNLGKLNVSADSTAQKMQNITKSAGYKYASTWKSTETLKASEKVAGSDSVSHKLSDTAQRAVSSISANSETWDAALSASESYSEKAAKSSGTTRQISVGKQDLFSSIIAGAKNGLAGDGTGFDKHIEGMFGSGAEAQKFKSAIQSGDDQFAKNMLEGLYQSHFGNSQALVQEFDDGVGIEDVGKFRENYNNMSQQTASSGVMASMFEAASVVSSDSSEPIREAANILRNAHEAGAMLQSNAGPLQPAASFTANENALFQVLKDQARNINFDDPTNVDLPDKYSKLDKTGSEYAAAFARVQMREGHITGRMDQQEHGLTSQSAMQAHFEEIGGGHGLNFQQFDQAMKATGSDSFTGLFGIAAGSRADAPPPTSGNVPQDVTKLTRAPERAMIGAAYGGFEKNWNEEATDEFKTFFGNDMNRAFTTITGINGAQASDLHKEYKRGESARGAAEAFVDGGNKEEVSAPKAITGALLGKGQFEGGTDDASSFRQAASITSGIAGSVESYLDQKNNPINK